uniref:Condensin complex subunit 2 n=1 Tax=Timema poppense TaxID=170557 RepID=A0A7R9CU19_TIMPO|nr:unnamed protein product [Timema poppensis]
MDQTKKRRALWTEKQLQDAMKAIADGMPVRSAALRFKIPRWTLRCHSAPPSISQLIQDKTVSRKRVSKHKDSLDSSSTTSDSFSLHDESSDNEDVLETSFKDILYTPEVKKKNTNKRRKSLNYQAIEEKVQPPTYDSTKVEGEIRFTEVFKELPSKLSATMIDNLSFPLAYIALLHLANEKCLLIVGDENLEDLMVSQDL